MIRIDHVTFSYGEENENAGGVHDINLTVEDGQCVVLCGESGSGKTTITRLINGLIPHYYEGKMNGEVWVNGAKVSEQPLYDTAKTVGSVFQNPRSQFFNVDTDSEIAFGMENEAVAQEKLRPRVDETARALHIEPFLGRSIFALSGGEKQRISIARSLLKHASVLLADEATAALDAQTAHQVTDDILSLTGVTRIVVTHTLEQAALRRYDGILVLKNGRIAESGTFDALMAQKGYFYALYTVSQ